MIHSERIDVRLVTISNRGRLVIVMDFHSFADILLSVFLTS